MAPIQLPKLGHPRRRLARGIAGKGGKTAGRGTKGQNARTGAHLRLPKSLLKTPKAKGFKRHTEKPKTLRYAVITNAFNANDLVSPKALVKLGLITAGQRVKIVGPRTDKKQLRYVGIPTSKSIHV
ncbi:uL15 family ribosomal protein [Candidatus Berkelbacteria bacterium]|nr:uL15 family ribosomal protein [Candidatus Berkelbacteria bacterium]